MAPVPTKSPVTGNAVPEHYVHASSAHFRATDGRTILLRGINLTSSAKTPRGQPGQKLEGFWEGAKSGDMSWVGRILELDEADEHLQRLKWWGFTCLRFVTTWEAIEHAGPGKYDTEYFDYVVALLRKCKQYGFRVYIDPHQDLWSRFSGGSGAPYWTILACGLEPQNFTKTRAAVIECEWPDAENPDPASFPKMIWATNYARLAVQTIFTLFFAGREYAPKCVIDGVNIQDYLQEHFFNAYRKLGEAIAEAGDLLDETVIGWDSLNEPNAGYVGVDDLSHHGKESVLRVGPMPTGLQAMRMGMGERMEVENWKSGPLGPKRDGSVVVDPQGTIAWLAPEAEPNGRSPWGWQRDPGWKLGTCLWAQHGVWNVETGEIVKPAYFSECKGRPAEFGADFWLPFFLKWVPVIRQVHPEAILFAHSPVFQIPPRIESPELKNRVAFSSHFYDGLTLITKHWNWFNADAIGILRGKYASVVLGVKVGEAAIRRCMRDQLGVLRQDGFDAIGQVPFMMGEIGIPYDLDDKRSYKTGNYAQQVRALDASLSACDGKNLMNYTTWCYCPDNCHLTGDRWNGEDLSVWSPDDILHPGGKPSSAASASSSGASSPVDTKGRNSPASDAPADPEHPINLNDGARGLPAFVRPYPLRTVGTPINLEFDIKTSKFKLEVKVEADDVADSNLPTEIYVPLSHYASHPQHMSFDVREADRRHRLTGTLRNPKAGDIGDETVVVGEGGDVNPPDESARDLALKVKISAGRYELDAEKQLLRWYYPRPASGSMTATIEFERVGGAIPLWISQWYRGGFDRVEQKNWNGNFCSLVGVTLVGLIGVTVTATSFFR